MMDSIDEAAAVADSGEREAWPLRPLLLALVGLATGFGIYWFSAPPDGSYQPLDAMHLAGVVGLLIGAGTFGFTLERRGWALSIGFALAMGLLAAGVTWWGGAGDSWSAGSQWRLHCLFLAGAIAVTLFQAARDAGALRSPYPSVHAHAWTNVVLWGASWVFALIVFGIAWLLAALFALIDLDFLRKLLEERWFAFSLIGAGYGLGLGLLRERDAVVRVLQRVVAIVLSVLAPVLGFGLLLFVLAIPFTGFGKLWDAWGSSAAVLLACTVAALALANVVIADTPEDEARNPVLRAGAGALAIVALPLAGLAAVAIGMRIGQYGFTPQRLWAMTFATIACAYGLAYWVALARGRLNWAAKVRPLNLALAIAVGAIGLVLATPLVSFDAISTNDQVARLESGKTPADSFDWEALAYRFGEPGKAALARLKASKNPAIAAQAARATSEDRWALRRETEIAERSARIAENFRVLPAGAALPDALRLALSTRYECDDWHCTVVLLEGGNDALMINDGCMVAPPGEGDEKSVREMRVAMVAGACDLTHYVRTSDGWSDPGNAASRDLTDAQWAAIDAAYKAGKVEVREVTRRQAFVGGVPVGEPFP